MTIIYCQKFDVHVQINCTAYKHLVCILPHCRLRDWCGDLRMDSGHVVCRLDQSASFSIFDYTFYFPHSTIHILPTAIYVMCVSATQQCNLYGLTEVTTDTTISNPYQLNKQVK